MKGDPLDEIVCLLFCRLSKLTYADAIYMCGRVTTIWHQDVVGMLTSKCMIMVNHFFVLQMLKNAQLLIIAKTEQFRMLCWASDGKLKESQMSFQSIIKIISKNCSQQKNFLRKKKFLTEHYQFVDNFIDWIIYTNFVVVLIFNCMVLFIRHSSEPGHFAENVSQTLRRIPFSIWY